jgi:cyclophilin family peptidyl-prolyl cis-trans isomerase
MARPNIHPTILVLSLALGLALQSCSQETADTRAASNAETAAPSSGGNRGPAADPIATLDAFIKAQDIDTSRPNWKTELPKPPRAEFSGDAEYFWVLTTNLGDLKLKLMPEVAPMHVSSTIYLTKLGFYDDVKFHRVIQGFMAQGGDPLGNGRGGPGYQYAGEFSPNVRHNGRGLLSMANAGPGTDGSQFFITFTRTPHLDDKHTLFGKLVGGGEVLTQMEKLGTPRGATREPLLIEKATILVE